MAELSLGAYFGRYRGWRSALDASVLVTTDTQGSDAPVLPEGALVVQFEATVKEDLRVGLAKHGASHWLYEVGLGFNGNTEVTMRKAVSTNKEIELASVFSGRTCSDEHFIPYWVVAQQGSICVGIGTDVGADPVLKCTDTTAPECVHQLAVTTWNHNATVRNLRVEYVTTSPLPMDTWVPRVIVRADPHGTEDLLTETQRAEYQQAYDTSLKRVQRFGGEFIAPDIKKYLDPKVIRRLQRTGATERGFTTGFDLTSQEEASKREARMKRFDMPQFAVEYSSETARALEAGMTQEEWTAKQAEKEKLRERALKFGLDPDANPKAGASRINLKPASRKVREERCDVKVDTMVEYRDDAIHVYSLDERFQQVRTSDIMDYFTGYGPWYVEWINDSSCTIVFEDAGSAGRALIALSDEVSPQSRKSKVDAESTAPAAEPVVPTGDTDVDMDDEAPASEVPVTTESAEVPDDEFNRSQWRYGRLIGSRTQPETKKWRLLLRRATSDDFPPEKNKRYHERRSAPQPRGRGHRDAMNEGLRSSRHGGSARSYPYGRNNDSRGRRGGRNRVGSDADGNESPSQGGKPSNRVRVNEDGSIDFIRNKPEAAQPSDS